MPKTTRLVERQLELFAIFKMAIKAEQEAQHMYQDALTRCDDADLRRILGSLRDDERRHEKEIKQMCRDLKRVIEIEEIATPKKRRSIATKVTSKTARQ
jgi:rubrerythrin